MGTALAVLIVSAWSSFFLVYASGGAEARSQASLYASFRQQLASATAPLGGQISEGAPIALLDFPAAGVRDTVVVEGTRSGDLMAGPGHRTDTVIPGQVGISVVYGRAVSFGGPFAKLAQAPVGSIITVTTGQGKFSYRVRDLRRVGDPLPPDVAAGGGRLVLVTAVGAGHDWLGRLLPKSELYLDADLQGTPVAPAGVVTAAPPSAWAMAGDTSVLPLVMIWLQGLLVAVGFGIWAWVRWGRLQSWLVAGIPALACAWGLSMAVAGLLPNLF